MVEGIMEAIIEEDTMEATIEEVTMEAIIEEDTIADTMDIEDIIGGMAGGMAGGGWGNGWGWAGLGFLGGAYWFGSAPANAYIPNYYPPDYTTNGGAWQWIPGVDDSDGYSVWVPTDANGDPTTGNDQFPTGGATILDTFGTPNTDSATVVVPLGDGKSSNIKLPSTVVIGANTTVIDVPSGKGTSIFISFGNQNNPPNTKPGSAGSWKWIASSNGSGFWEWMPTDADGNPTTLMDRTVPAETDAGGEAHNPQ